jgi:hypothetical protein
MYELNFASDRCDELTGSPLGDLDAHCLQCCYSIVDSRQGGLGSEACLDRVGSGSGASAWTQPRSEPSDTSYCSASRQQCIHSPNLSSNYNRSVLSISASMMPSH